MGGRPQRSRRRGGDDNRRNAAADSFRHVTFILGTATSLSYIMSHPLLLGGKTPQSAGIISAPIVEAFGFQRRVWRPSYYAAPVETTVTSSSSSSSSRRRRPTTTTPSSSSGVLSMSSSYYVEDLYGAIHRKEHEMSMFKKEHQGTTDPIQVAMGYVEESLPRLRVAKALRRVYDDPDYDPDDDNWQDKLDGRPTTISTRMGSFVVDVKRKSLSCPGQTFAMFDDAGTVASAMVDMGADCVFINVDYSAYGGDISELKSVVRAVRRASPTAAVVMKDIVVDEVQIGIAKEAGADGIVLIASVLGPALSNFMDLCTVIGLESIVEVHTKNEIDAALNAMAQTLLVTNHDRMTGRYFPDQAEKLAGMFPGSGPIVALATGGIESPEQVRDLLCAGYDGVVVGKAIMGNPGAHRFIKEVRDRPLLPAEFSGWGLDDDVDVGMDGSLGIDGLGGQPDDLMP